MAAPTSTNEVTVRRLSSVITQLWAKIKDTFASKSHNHNASDINTGTLPTARGGTGMSKDSTKDVAIGIHNSLSDWSGDSVNILETETIAAFGTGSSAGRYTIGKIYNWIKGKLESVFAASSHSHAASDINSGTLPIARGGTGGSSAKDSVTNIIQGVHDSGNASSVGAADIVVASWGTTVKTSGWYTIGALRDWLKTNLGLTASDVGAASSSHSHSDYVSKSTTSAQNINSNLRGPRFEVKDDDGNYGAFLVDGNGNVRIKGHTGNDVLVIKKKDDASGVASITASYDWNFNNEINASISGRASYLKDVSTDGARTNNCYLKWSSTDISKVSPSASGSTLSETKYLAAWETESNGGNPNVNAVNAGNVTVGNSEKWGGYKISVGTSIGTATDTIYFVK